MVQSTAFHFADQAEDKLLAAKAALREAQANMDHNYREIASISLNDAFRHLSEDNKYTADIGKALLKAYRWSQWIDKKHGINR